jgi:hypothetical protein
MTTTTMVAHKTLLLLSGYKLFLLKMQWAWHSPCMRILFTFRPTGDGRVVYLIWYVGDSSSAKLHYISLTRDSLWDKCVVESSQKLCRYQSRKWKLWIAERHIVQWSKHKTRHDKLWPTKHYTKKQTKNRVTRTSIKLGRGLHSDIPAM